MFRLTRSIPALGAVFFVAVALSACGGGGLPGNAIVNIGGTPITTATFNHWMAVAVASSASGTVKPVQPVPPDYTACVTQLRALSPKPAKGQKAPTTAQLKAECATEYSSLKSQVVVFLIGAEWVILEAQQEGVHVSDAAVVTRFNQIKKQSFPTAAAYSTFLKQSGQTYSDLLLRVKIELLSNGLRSKVDKTVKISPAAITSYFNAHRSNFGTPATADLHLILTKTKAQAQAAKSAIQGGTAFATEAKNVSIDSATKSAGGVLNGVTPGQEEQALSNAIFAAPLNALQGPLQTPFGFYVFEVSKRTAGVQEDFAKAEGAIKQQLTSTAQSAALNKFIAGFQKKWTPKTDCRAGYVEQDCKQYKAPKTSTTPSTGITGG